MKGRLIVLVCGLVFSVTLGLTVGQRLSAQAMAVVIGVIAGVATSIPTSLIVVWFMGRNTVSQTVAEVSATSAAAPAMRMAEAAEPRITFIPAPQAQFAGYPGAPAYSAQSYTSYQPPAGPVYAPPVLPARQFTMIGGEMDGGNAEGEIELQPYIEESVAWQR